ncbi:hypothetical protein K458DRAFT_391496 [Lentithecium fluviatile CBS 122367]|uniref:Uncharacterized protein n=1 Tax=Lentithecium fluviatile CBS 122367 TaxID=1168545 RepID=A0A6G1IUR3_9PLEO|nr:hypothetical protein K458DRAFT_391496 [Lentithecium fluviatile CBS 122367]
MKKRKLGENKDPLGDCEIPEHTSKRPKTCNKSCGPRRRVPAKEVTRWQNLGYKPGMVGEQATQTKAGELQGLDEAPECQKFDWHLHKLLCNAFKNFGTEAAPGPDYYSAFFFPEAGPKPRFVWVRMVKTPDGRDVCDPRGLGWQPASKPSVFLDWDKSLILDRAYDLVQRIGIREPVSNTPMGLENKYMVDISGRLTRIPMENTPIQAVRMNCVGDLVVGRHPQFEPMILSSDTPSHISVTGERAKVLVVDKLGLPLRMVTLNQEAPWNDRKHEVDFTYNFQFTMLNPAQWRHLLGSVVVA